ncbi:MAG: hypothetical protein ACRDRA_03925 [Pseudonocardiaceae bacterium]
MSKDTGAHRRWRRRAVTVIGLGVATVAALAVPALAHPVFSNNGPGFPNPYGGTGAAGQTPPYAAGSRPTLNMFLPFEQEGVIFNGAENTTTDVKVTVPVGWTSPACGAVSISVGNRQVGTIVPGWNCTIETVNAHQVLHWTGPQVSPSQTFADSAQFFTFQATMPSPATTTSYGAKDGPEGIHVKQVYADGATSLWKPPNSNQTGEVANGLVRTVARASGPPPTPAPKPGGTQPGEAPPGGTQSGGTQSGGTQPGGTQPGGTKSGGPPPQAQGGGGSTPPPTEPSPEISPQPSAVEQLTQQRDEAALRGVRWTAVVGAVLAFMLVAGAVIAFVRWRRRFL